MKILNTESIREINGGGYYCKVCHGYTNNSRLRVMAHVATKHPLDWLLKFTELLVGLA